MELEATQVCVLRVCADRAFRWVGSVFVELAHQQCSPGMLRAPLNMHTRIKQVTQEHQRSGHAGTTLCWNTC